MALTDKIEKLEKKVVEVKRIRINEKYIPYVLSGRRGCLRLVSMKQAEDNRYFSEVEIKIDSTHYTTLYLHESTFLNFNFNHQIEIECTKMQDSSAMIFDIEIYE